MCGVGVHNPGGWQCSLPCRASRSGPGPVEGRRCAVLLPHAHRRRVLHAGRRLRRQAARLLLRHPERPWSSALVFRSGSLIAVRRSIAARSAGSRVGHRRRRRERQRPPRSRCEAWSEALRRFRRWRQGGRQARRFAWPTSQRSRARYRPGKEDSKRHTPHLRCLRTAAQSAGSTPAIMECVAPVCGAVASEDAC